MKTPESCERAMRIVETITVLNIDDALPPGLQTGLGYAAAPYWASDGKLYILNCALADAAILCVRACKTEFLWGRAGEPLGRYKSLRGEAVFVEIAAAAELPTDYMNYALLYGLSSREGRQKAHGKIRELFIEIS